MEQSEKSATQTSLAGTVHSYIISSLLLLLLVVAPVFSSVCVFLLFLSHDINGFC